MQAYSDPSREDDPHALPDLEVFELTAREVVELDEDMLHEYASLHEFSLAGMNSKVRDFIVRAVNAHDDLLAALRALAHLSGVLNARQQAGLPITPAMWSELYQRTNEANAAIAKAEGR